jgi:hypothetical protein
MCLLETAERLGHQEWQELWLSNSFWEIDSFFFRARVEVSDLLLKTRKHWTNLLLHHFRTSISLGQAKIRSVGCPPFANDIDAVLNLKRLKIFPAYCIR